MPFEAHIKDPDTKTTALVEAEVIALDPMPAVQVPATVTFPDVLAIPAPVEVPPDTFPVTITGPVPFIIPHPTEPTTFPVTVTLPLDEL
jgi:hypothetical protein